MVTQKYLYIDRKFAEERERRGNACEVCHKPLKFSQGEFMHLQPTEVHGEGRGRYERLKDILTYPESYKLACEKCHGKRDVADYVARGNPRRMGSEQASSAVKRAMRRAGKSAMGGHQKLGGLE